MFSITVNETEFDELIYGLNHNFIEKSNTYGKLWSKLQIIQKKVKSGWKNRLKNESVQLKYASKQKNYYIFTINTKNWGVTIALILENRWSTMIMKVIGDDFAAQKCLNPGKFVTAMDGWSFQQWSSCANLASNAKNRALPMPADEDYTKNKHK